MQKLTPGERVKFAILGNRLGITGANAYKLFQSIKQETAQTMKIPESAINSDVNFYGRDFDIVFTINKQNTPK